MICEDYYNRHKIDVPIVKHIDFGVLFFKSNNKPQRKIIFIKSKDNWACGSDYVISETFVYQKDKPLGISTEIIREVEISWDEYENFILNLKNEFDLIDYEIILNVQEIDLFIWEAFVFSNQKYLFKEFSHLEKLIFESINLENSLSTRYVNYHLFMDECIKFKNINEFVECWNDNYRFYVSQNYTHQLAKLIANS